MLMTVFWNAHWSLVLAPHMLTMNTREQGSDRLMGKAKLKDCIHT